MQSCNEGGLATMFANQDAVFVLCYAILMLHTDLHNSRLKQKMSLEVVSTMMLTIMDLCF